jgi:hypothetical protein
MKLQYHVNTLETGFWPRCREVSIVDGQVSCELALDRAYDLGRAYQHDPHLRFMDCTTVKEIVAFVRTWGPLSSSADEMKCGACSAPLSTYWNFQSWLKGLVNLLNAFKNSAGEREALQKFIKAEIDNWRSSVIGPAEGEPLLILGLRIEFGVEGDVAAWVNDSPLSSVRSAIELMIATTPVGVRPSFESVRRSGKATVEARWRIESLETGLTWMVWYDEFTQHPLVCCWACRRMFRPETAHARKYCTYECAHRIAAREWQRKQRKLRSN